MCSLLCDFVMCFLCCLLSDSFDVLDGSDAVTQPEEPGSALDTCHWRSWKNNCRGFLCLSINARQLPPVIKQPTNICEGPQSRQVVPVCQRWADSRAKHSWTMRGPRELGLVFPKNLLELLGEGTLRSSPGANHRQHNLFLLPPPEGSSDLDLQLLLSPSYAWCPLYSRLPKGLRSQDFLSELQLRVAKRAWIHL